MNEAWKEYLDRSVLCWLATASNDGMPNVSPKEIFDVYNGCIIIANIASPQSVRNIKSNAQVCVSFIDILVQKGYQVKGRAEILISDDPLFVDMEGVLLKQTEGKFPFRQIIKVEVQTSKPIVAPRYLLYPETTEEDQIQTAKNQYKI